MRISAKKRDDTKRLKVLASEESRRKKSEATKGRKMTGKVLEELRKRNSSLTYRAKMSAVMKGIKITTLHKLRISNAKLGIFNIILKNSDLVETLISIRNFSKKYKLDRHKISLLIKGELKSYEGWILLNSKDEK